MSFLKNNLTFNTLRSANISRLPKFKNKHGKLAHSKPDGSDWTPSDWLEAVIGELGEYANIHKKFRRGDLSFEEYKIEAAKELADVQIYLDILALRCLDTPEKVDPIGIDLGEATINKFNEVSKRVGANVYISKTSIYQKYPTIDANLDNYAEIEPDIFMSYVSKVTDKTENINVISSFSEII